MKDELIVYVTPDGKPTGETAPKLAAHNLHTRLHSAFSCYVFNPSGKLLVTQRAHEKKVWPGVWTNSVCGHPLPEEEIIDAIRRRLDYELGMRASNFQLVLPDYVYETPAFKGVVEHEYCPVYIAQTQDEPKPNPDEVAGTRWVEWEELVHELADDSSNYWSWWVKDQVSRLEKNPEFKAKITSFFV